MLSDDIIQTGRSGFSKLKAILGGAVRGAAIGALAVVAGAFIAFGLVPGIIGAIGAASVGAGLAALGEGIIAGATAVAGAGSGILLGAEIGAGVLAASSIIPGADRGFGLKGLFKRRPDPERMPGFTADGKTVDLATVDQVNLAQRPIVVHQSPPQVVVHENRQPLLLQDRPQTVLLEAPHHPQQMAPHHECPAPVIINSNTPQVFVKETRTENSPTLALQETTANVVTAQDNTQVKDNTANILATRDNTANVTEKDNTTSITAKDNTTTLIPQENYLYQPGLGMKLMEKGDAAPATNLQRA